MGKQMVEEVFETLDSLGTLRSRSMFGGFGLYCDDVFFGLAAEGILFFKVDEENRGAYLERDAAPFLFGVEQPTHKQLYESSYYEVPMEVQERPTEFLEWARSALEAAKRKEARKKPRKARPKSAKGKPSAASVRSLKNLGPQSAKWLGAIGIRSREDLEVRGALGAYLEMLEQGVSPNWNLLYALEAGLMGLHVNHLPAVVKESLRERATAGLRRRKA